MEAHRLLPPLLLVVIAAAAGARDIYFLPLAVTLGGAAFLHLFNIAWLKPRKARGVLRKQGIGGPPPSLLHGNVPEMQRIQSAAARAAAHGGVGEFVAHDYASTLFPYFEQWRKEYGSIYTYSTGNKQHLYVNHPELVKEMNQSMSLDLGKPSYVTKRLAPMLGNGILRSNGHLWAHQRKIVAPQFFMDKVKGMVGLMVESSLPMLRKWEASIDAAMAEVRVDDDLRSVSADVISRTCFGSSYLRGKEIFSKLRTLQKTISKQGFLFSFPSFGVLPNKKQREMRRLEREIETLIWEVVKEREEDRSGASLAQKDLMQLILEGAINDHGLVDNNNYKNNSVYSSWRSFVVDNCKNIYFAGHESTAVAASWCLMLLALHPDWQARVREEVARVCPGGQPDADSLPKLRMVTMVIQEALRLYPPAAFVSREALEETRIGNLTVPKGVCMWTLIPTLHRDPENWGPDAGEFRPERFAAGLAGACRNPNAYVPFGLGPRLCLGRNFAMTQLKVVLSLVVSTFEFCLSPNYHHSPAYRMIVEPGYGVQIIIQRRERE
ncbi:hypothetical protein NMG60_11018283 [Bertholletia excelsa]